MKQKQYIIHTSGEIVEIQKKAYIVEANSKEKAQEILNKFIDAILLEMYRCRHPVELPEEEGSALPVPPIPFPGFLRFQDHLLSQSTLPLDLGKRKHRTWREILVKVHPVQKYLKRGYAVETALTGFFPDLYSLCKIQSPVCTQVVI